MRTEQTGDKNYRFKLIRSPNWGEMKFVCALDVSFVRTELSKNRKMRMGKTYPACVNGEHKVGS